MDVPQTTASGRGEPQAAACGSWESPITARLMAEGGVGLGQPQGLGESLYWIELRPLEDGRYVVVRRDPAGAIADVTPQGWGARTLVHEYGGGMYTAFRNECGGESVLFSSLADQRLYLQDLLPEGGGWSLPRPVTPEPPEPRAVRYADGRVTPGGRTLVCVRERHEADGAVVNELVALPADGSAPPVVVAAGHDFYAAPRIDPAGRRLAWICWDHPLMPWDGTELHVAELTADEAADENADEAADGEVRADGGSSIADERLIAGGADESVLQPLWAPDGALVYASDRSGWYNLYRAGADELDGGPPQARPLAPRAAEFAKVPWVFGLRQAVFLDDGSLLVSLTEEGGDRLAVVSADGELRFVDSPFTVIRSLAPLGGRAGVIGASHTEGDRVAVVDPALATTEVVRRGRHASIDPAFVSHPEPITFPTDDGLVAHANFYPPLNPGFVVPAGELPPLLVTAHGGPTGASESGLDLDVQYWTSRGFAVVEVNYGGSTGYGREYRERLRGRWGVVDTVDCINAARYLIARGDADPRRVGVRGGSAGGYTTLNALTRHAVFTAGASLFGLADLESFATGGTHKFESQYLDSLIGPYPELRDVYRDRSPIHHVDDLECPVILLQGLEDVIVPPAQSEIIVEALAAKGLPHAYLAFEGEQHGFRKAENIVRSQEAELYFYGRVWGFTPADPIEPVAIENLA